MINKNKIAKTIRVATVPPIMVLLLFVVLFVFRRNIFNNVFDLILSILCFSVIPTLAYPLQKLISKNQNTARKVQRNLAFVFSFSGYLLAVLYGFFAHISRELSLIYHGYFISVLILILSNTLLKIKASGHGCSITGTLIYLIYFMGYEFILPCAILLFLVYWSSIKLKRHTFYELTSGCIIALISFFLSLNIS